VSLTAKDVAQITRLLEESSFDELYLELDGLKLSLRRGSAANVQSPVDPASVGTAAAGTAVAGTAAAGAAAAGAAAAGAAAAGAATAAAGAATPASSQAAQPASSGPLQVTVSSAPTDDGALTDPNTPAVSAPLLGTFYRAPKPGAPPFVEIGSQVADDTIVGIIEVMKLMNTVRAGIRGEVVEILARDGALVEYGEALMRVRKTS
jgi:acetyl-CoA carboxylase biotin carboxyl carrier protein